MKKRICSIILSIILLSTVPGAAHSGRTDSSGGHKDNKNKSGLGYYHYHCGGNPPHLHKNGSCPYSGESSSYQTTTAQKTVVATPKAMIPNFSVKINGTEINNTSSEYPVLNYNNITYIPLTSDLLTYLDISYDWNNPNGIIVNRTSQAVNKGAFVSAFNNGYSVKGQSKQISKVGKAMIINGKAVDSNEYPIINFSGVNYLPLTTDVINNLGLKSSWNEYEGFSLYN